MRWDRIFSVLWIRTLAASGRTLLIVHVAYAVGACSSAPKLEGEGGACQQVADCQMGLVCVKGPNDTKRCSKDLSSIVSATPAPMGGGGGDAGGAGAAVDAAE
jgi:hypothetical protein